MGRRPNAELNGIALHWQKAKYSGAEVRVVHLCNIALPREHPDAKKLKWHPGRWVLNLAIAQRKYAGIDARLLMHVPGARKDFEMQIEGVPVRFLAVPDKHRSATLFYFDRRRLAKAALEMKPDFVHGHGTEDAYSLGAQSTGLPYVLTAQGLFFLINSFLPPRLLSRERVVEFTERMALRRARHIIAKSDYVGAELFRKFPHLQVHRIPNTLDEHLREISVGSKEVDTIAFVGTVIERKGVDTLCDALERVKRDIPRVRLLVFGDHGPDVESPYEQGIRKRLTGILGDNVQFHGVVSAVDVARHVARSVALVAPSVEEMFGNQLVEALAVGTHGIVTEGTAMGENVRRYGNGTVVPQKNAAALAEAITRALTNPATPEVTEKARRNVWQDLGPASVAQRHLELYQQIIREW